jgi:uncharacterized protein (UPF0333 family)
MLIHPHKVISRMVKRNRRGQAALEFLMTYSWAILVVIIVIGALAYFGVLDPSNLIPQTCKLEAGFNCADYSITRSGTNAQISLVLQNNIGRPIELTSIQFNTTTGGGCTAPAPAAPNNIIGNGATSVPIQSAATGCNIVSPDKKNRYTMTIGYRYADVGTAALPQTMQGEIFARAQ